MNAFSCPMPDSPGSEDRVSLALGDGGRVTRRWIRERLLPRLGNLSLDALSDAAELPGGSEPLAFTTDSFVVSPLEFPGGDIGRLAVFGTVNDLAVSGALPLWLSLTLILEEGLSLGRLDAVLSSVADAAREANVRIVTGDTKVVPRGAADQLFLTTAGIGRLCAPRVPGPQALAEGDEILVTGPVGRHGVAILAHRENLGFEPSPSSDCAPLTPAVQALRAAGLPLRAMRDATRGGVAAVLHEFAEASGKTLWIDETALPRCDAARGVCELLGLDPLHLACEGTMVCVVPPGAGDAAVSALRTVAVSSQAARIGVVRPNVGTPVVVRRQLGMEQALDEPSGIPLPRIC